jgi:hypothetical protein
VADSLLAALEHGRSLRDEDALSGLHGPRGRLDRLDRNGQARAAVGPREPIWLARPSRPNHVRTPLYGRPRSRALQRLLSQRTPRRTPRH